MVHYVHGVFPLIMTGWSGTQRDPGSLPMSPRIKVQRVWQQVEEEWQVILRPGLCLLSFMHNVCVPKCTNCFMKLVFMKLTALLLESNSDIQRSVTKHGDSHK